MVGWGLGYGRRRVGFHKQVELNATARQAESFGSSSLYSL